MKMSEVLLQKSLLEIISFDFNKILLDLQIH